MIKYILILIFILHIQNAYSQEYQIVNVNDNHSKITSIVHNEEWNTVTVSINIFDKSRFKKSKQNTSPKNNTVLIRQYDLIFMPDIEISLSLDANFYNVKNNEVSGEAGVIYLNEEYIGINYKIKY
jgi:hypothetical protein